MASETAEFTSSKTEVDATFDRIQEYKDVTNVVVTNKDGLVIRSSKGMDDEVAAKIGDSVVKTAISARGCISSLFPDEDLQFLSIKTKKHEVLVAPDDSYVLILALSADNK